MFVWVVNTRNVVGIGAARIAPRLNGVIRRGAVTSTTHIPEWSPPPRKIFQSKVNRLKSRKSTTFLFVFLFSLLFPFYVYSVIEEESIDLKVIVVNNGMCHDTYLLLTECTFFRTNQFQSPTFSVLHDW